MIKIPEDSLRSQEGMERAFAHYFDCLYKGHEDTLNALLKPEVVACDYEKRSLTVAVPTKKWMTNPNLILHGGITATVADMVMGLVSRYFSGGKLTPTVNMNVSYLSSVPMDAKLYCRATCVRAGFSMIYVRAELWAEGREDDLAATATATYYVNPRMPK